MSRLFDDIARAVASDASRRRVFRIVAGSFAGAAITPFHSSDVLANSPPPCEPPTCSGLLSIPCGCDCCIGFEGMICGNPGPPAQCCFASEKCGEGCCDANFFVCRDNTCMSKVAFENLNLVVNFQIVPNSLVAETRADGIVVVRWETVAEEGISDFSLYRAGAEGGPYNRINSDLIPATGLGGGASYAVEDPTGHANHRYILEVKDILDLTMLFGPVRVLVTDARTHMHHVRRLERQKRLMHIR
jgi:hypothetical protein